MSTTSFDAQDADPNELPASEPWSDGQLANYDQVVTDLNAQIMEVMMSIRQEFPELLKFVDEMPITIPDKQHPAITLNNLKSYHTSLVWMLSKYRKDHPPVV